MQRYLNQLQADIENAIRSAPEHISMRVIHPFSDEEERSTSISRHLRLSDLFGLNRYAFPPSERLTKKQLTALLQAIEQLWRAWSIRWSAPPRLTARPRYTIMVEKMTSEKVDYHYEFGADIDFCSDKEHGKCPFGQDGTCFCKEMEASEAEYTDTLALDFPGHFDDFQREHQESPSESLERWLYGDDAYFQPWLLEEGKERWTEFMAEEEMMAWLYFYQPRHPEIFEEEEELLSPEDFEDFDWDDDFDVDMELPF